MSDGLTVVGMKLGDDETIVVETVAGTRILTKDHAWDELKALLLDPQIPHDVVTSQGGITPDTLVEQGCSVLQRCVEQDYGGFAGALAGEASKRILNALRGGKKS